MVTEYIKRLKIKLQSKSISRYENFQYANLCLNPLDLVNKKQSITHSQWAHIILGSIIIGTILGYDKYYPVLSQMHYIFAIAIAIIGVTIIRIIQSRFRWRLFTKLLILFINYSLLV